MLEALAGDSMLLHIPFYNRIPTSHRYVPPDLDIAIENKKRHRRWRGDASYASIANNMTPNTTLRTPSKSPELN
jgi:hypothetical protein